MKCLFFFTKEIEGNQVAEKVNATGTVGRLCEDKNLLGNRNSISMDKSCRVQIPTLNKT